MRLIRGVTLGGILIVSLLIVLVGISALSRNSITIVPASGSTRNPNGLQFNFSINTTSLATGRWLGPIINVFNTLNKTNKVAVASNWALPALLNDQLCPGSPWPTSVVVYQGRYTLANLSTANPMATWKAPGYAVPCIATNFISFTFQPASDKATYQTSMLDAYSNHTWEFQRTFPVKGYYTNEETAVNGQLPLNNFASGQYTIVGGDEWGDLVVLYISIT